jgi:hypothetical protein
MENSNDNNNSLLNILYNLVITIGIILLLCLGTYAVYTLVIPKNKSTDFATSDASNSVTSETTYKFTPVPEQSLLYSSDSESSYKVYPTSEQIVAEIAQYPIGQQNVNPILPETKQTYKKYDEITLPSSLSPTTGGYIGRDYICFRNKLGDTSYVSKNSGCMACQVDNSGKNNNYSNTQTNVVATCVYTTDPNNTDPSVWTKQMCINSCAKLTDVQ